MCDVSGETSGLNSGLPRWVEKRKHTDSPVKQMFLVQWSVKKGMLTIFWDMKVPITIDYLEKKAQL